MKLSKYILMISALLMGAAAYADDFDSFGSFGEDESAEGSSSKLEVGADAETEIRAYVDIDEAKAEAVELDLAPSANLNLKYNGNKSDAEISLKIAKVVALDQEIPARYFTQNFLTTGK